VLVNLIAINQMDHYDSDSSDGGSEFPSQSRIPENPFNDPNYETYKHCMPFMIVDHTANQRNGSEISKIWQHGGGRRRVDDGSMDRYWRCGHCKSKRILKCPETGKGATSYPIRHLKNRHLIDLNADHQALPLQPTSFFGTVAGAAASAATAAVTQTAGKLISTMNMDRFRYLFRTLSSQRIL
jgi:DNA-directed RNA polymerase subunit RPC12/RpoP